MTRLVVWAGLAAAVAASLALGLQTDGTGATPATRADRIAAGLRCPVCQGLSVKDSDSPTARDMRADIRRRVDDGQSPDEVRQAYVERYGEWILLRPGTTGFDALVWVVPAAVIGGGAVVLGGVFWRWRREGSARRPTDEDRRLVAAAASRRPVAAPPS